MPDVDIRIWTALAAADSKKLVADLDHVFFTSSARRSFAGAAEKRDFRERWLGRYLSHYPEFALVALTASQRAVGYVVGSMSDPLHDPIFSDLTFLAPFATQTARYPAQLHVNLDADWRGQGLGARLVGAFADMAREAGARGVHVVTVRGMRNVGFYTANGFVERASLMQDGRELLFLGRDL